MSAAPDRIDATISCSQCEALCCRLTVVLQPGDEVAAHLTWHTDRGLRVMAREDGWCVALDASHRCSIYATRPAACRRFATGGSSCREVRAEAAHPLALTLA